MFENLLEQSQHGGCIESLFGPFRNIILKHRSNFNLGSALETYDFVLELIFKYLNRFDLQIIQQVNTKWNRLATAELNKRLSASWLACNALDLRERALHNEHRFLYNNTTVGIVFYNYSAIMLHTYVCLHSSTETIRMPFAEYIRKEIIHNSNIDCFAVACTPIYLDIYEHHGRLGFYESMFQCLLFPAIPNICISLQHYSQRVTDCLQSIKSDEIVRCVIFFAQYFDDIILQDCLDYIQKRNSSSLFIFGGGTVQSSKCFIKNYLKKYYYVRDLYYIQFSQKANATTDFDAYSEVLCYTTLDSELLKVKSKMVLRKYGVVYTFCGAHDENNVKKVSLFKTYFPQYQHICLLVATQIGQTSGNIMRGSVTATHLKDAVVIVVLTWGPFIKS